MPLNTAEKFNSLTYKQKKLIILAYFKTKRKIEDPKTEFNAISSIDAAYVRYNSLEYITRDLGQDFANWLGECIDFEIEDADEKLQKLEKELKKAA